MTEASSSKKRPRSPNDNDEHPLGRDQICSSLGGCYSFSSLVASLVCLQSQKTETITVFNSSDDAEDNLTFNDTMIALQLMRTQFPKLEKVLCLPYKYGLIFPILLSH